MLIHGGTHDADRIRAASRTTGREPAAKMSLADVFCKGVKKSSDTLRKCISQIHEQYAEMITDMILDQHPPEKVDIMVSQFKTEPDNMGGELRTMCSSYMRQISLPTEV